MASRSGSSTMSSQEPCTRSAPAARANASVSLTRFGGHRSKGGYGVDHGRGKEAEATITTTTNIWCGSDPARRSGAASFAAKAAGGCQGTSAQGRHVADGERPEARGCLVHEVDGRDRQAPP